MQNKTIFSNKKDACSVPVVSGSKGVTEFKGKNVSYQFTRILFMKD